MEKDTFTHVLCAIRGGPESRETATRAIDMALENDAHLTFCHVLDAEFLQHATIGPLSIVYKELREMGEFAMMILVDRAERRGVKRVDYLLRSGNVRRQLLMVAKETEAGIMVVGKPIRSPGSNVFRVNEIESFAEVLRREGNIQVITVSPS